MPPIPGGKYSKKDQEKEALFAAIDFYDENIGLCPKTWSTSPGTMVRNLQGSELKQGQYERHKCKGKDVPPGVKKLATYKQTMNQAGTSGTFSTSSLLYYHFSRYFDTSVKVPVAVYREMGRQSHFQRVSSRVVPGNLAKMIGAGWKHLRAAELNPASYRPTLELFTDDHKSIYGAFVRGQGARHGAEINGLRTKWGSVQCEEFQQTAPYYALRADSPLLQAISAGKAKAFKVAKIKQATGDASPFQMMYWMKELIETVLLDYIFSQQDRIGNIDFRWCWYWIAENKIQSQWDDSEEPRTRMAKIPIPPELHAFSPVLLQRMHLNDNDAGGRVPYTNFAKKTKMLAGLRHFSAELFRRIVELDRDLQASGPLYAYLRDSFGLSSAQVAQVVNNTRAAAEILQTAHVNGTLRFDLDGPQEFFRTGIVQEHIP